MCYKTDKIWKKTLKKQLLKKNIKKIESTVQRNVTAGIQTCNHLHDAPPTFELSKLVEFRGLQNVFNLRRQTYW